MTARDGILRSRPATAPPAPALPGRGSEESATGTFPLGFGGKRDGTLFVPAAYHPDRPAPLALMLHGAGGDARQALSLLGDLAEAKGLIVLAVDSRGRTWDVILDRFGPDVSFADRALAHVFGRYAVDPGRVAVGGFSDGASYALSLGLTNGDLFTHVVAFAPGFMAPQERRGEPRVYISHGTRDAVLPIVRCSRRIVPRLKREGYDVTYQEFDGPHAVPADVAREAADWFAG